MNIARTLSLLFSTAAVSVLLTACPKSINPSDPVGYVYTPGLRDDSPGDAVLLVDKFAPDLKHERIVIHADDSAAVQNLPRNHWW